MNAIFMLPNNQHFADFETHNTEITPLQKSHLHQEQ